MSSRMLEHLQRLRMFSGESVISLKYGSMQHAFHVQGHSLRKLPPPQGAGQHQPQLGISGPGAPPDLRHDNCMQLG